jgi:predicted metal-dependent enzyme (double-stranded beta helix superfamily)
MFDLQEFIVSCKQFVGAPDGARRVLDLMRSVVGDAEGIKSAVVPVVADERTSPIRDASLFRSSELFVLNATLKPHFKSPPHDHRMWAVIGIYEGQENNIFYRRAAKGLEEINRHEIRAGEAILLGPEVIHAIENPLGSSTLGLHVYGGDPVAAKRSMWHPRTGEELPYDVPQFFKWCAELAESPSAV